MFVSEVPNLKYVARAASFTEFSETMWRSGTETGLYE